MKINLKLTIPFLLLATFMLMLVGCGEGSQTADTSTPEAKVVAKMEVEPPATKKLSKPRPPTATATTKATEVPSTPTQVPPTPVATPTQVPPTVIPTSIPPYEGTLWIRNSSEIINESDPTLFDTLTKISDGPRKMFDRRNGWITVTPFLFEAIFTDGQSIEVQVNPEFESVGIAREIALIYLVPIGQLPSVLRQDVETIWLHKGKEHFGGGNNNLLIHHEQGLEYIKEGILEEAFLHEASHTSLDPYYYNNSWEEAQKADGNFISIYAKDFPTTEDVAESFPMYYALRYKPSRISRSLRDTIINTIPNRVIYFDENLPDLEATPQEP